jgi:hypothetical protein
MDITPQEATGATERPTFADHVRVATGALKTLLAFSDGLTEGTRDEVRSSLAFFERLRAVNMEILRDHMNEPSNEEHIDVTAYHGADPDEGWTGQLWKASEGGPWYCACFADPILSCVAAGALAVELESLPNYPSQTARLSHIKNTSESRVENA